MRILFGLSFLLMACMARGQKKCICVNSLNALQECASEYEYPNSVTYRICNENYLQDTGKVYQIYNCCSNELVYSWDYLFPKHEIIRSDSVLKITLFDSVLLLYPSNSRVLVPLLDIRLFPYKKPNEPIIGFSRSMPLFNKAQIDSIVIKFDDLIKKRLLKSDDLFLLAISSLSDQDAYRLFKSLKRLFEKKILKSDFVSFSYIVLNNWIMNYNK